MSRYAADLVVSVVCDWFIFTYVLQTDTNVYQMKPDLSCEKMYLNTDSVLFKIQFTENATECERMM